MIEDYRRGVNRRVVEFKKLFTVAVCNNNFLWNTNVIIYRNVCFWLPSLSSYSID